MKRRDVLCGAAALAAGAVLPVRALDRSRRFTASDVHARDYPTVEAVRWISETLARETDGRLHIDIYHSGQLGRESEAIDMARFGAIDITRVYGGALNNAFPLTQALCLPFVFESTAHLRRVIDGEVGTAVLNGFSTRGLVGLAIYDSGARGFYNTRRALHTPDDLKGLKFRVPGSDIFIELLRLFGANPTPLSFGAVYSALETRLIDGAENNMRSFHSSRHFEACAHWSDSNHSHAPDILLMSQRSFDAMTTDDQALLLETARQSVPYMRSLWDTSEARAREAVIAQGIEITAVDMTAFRRAAEPLMADYGQRTGIAPLLRHIRELA